MNVSIRLFRQVRHRDDSDRQLIAYGEGKREAPKAGRDLIAVMGTGTQHTDSQRIAYFCCEFPLWRRRKATVAANDFEADIHLSTSVRV